MHTPLVGPLRVLTVIWIVAGLALVLAGIGAGPASSPTQAADAEIAVDDPHGVRVDRRAGIAAEFPETVETGKRIRVTGTARLHGGARRAARPVRLLERTGGRWVVRVRATTTRTGAFVLRTPAGYRQRTRTFKVVASRFRGLPAASTRPARVAVLKQKEAAQPPPPEDPETPTQPEEEVALGDPNDWSYLFADGGARWNPCALIEWVYNPDGQPYVGALDDVRESLRLIADRTGLTFQYTGSTDYTQFVDPTSERPAKAQLFIAWADEVQVPRLAGSVVGVGGGSARRVDNEDVAMRFTSGYFVLDKDHRLRTGHDIAGTPTWGQVMNHESLHALGLGHAAGRDQVMYGSVSILNHRFGAGDLTGMTKIGAAQGCL